MYPRVSEGATLRGRAGAILLLMPTIVVAICDWSRRGSRLLALDALHMTIYGGAIVESAALWGLLLLVAAGRRGVAPWIAGACFVLLATVTVGGQRYFYDQFGTYLNLDAALLGISVPASLGGQLRADGGMMRAVIVPFVVAVVLVVSARRAIEPERRWSARSRWLLLVALAATLVLPCSYRAAQAATPDIIGLHAFGGVLYRVASGKLRHVTPGLRTPQFVPAVAPLPAAKRRNVLLIVTESVRFDAVCVDHQPGCARTPFTDRAAPDRLPLMQMRATDSTTAISVAVKWSGLAPSETREAIHSAPLIFDYAHAAGFDSAYWTSQNLMFANAGLFVHDLPVSRRCGALDLDADADIDLGAPDEKLTARVLQELPALREPWIAVVQYSNTHFPYRVDESDQPFAPATQSKHPDDNVAFMNYYRNAVYAQDRTIADLVSAVRQGPAGGRTVVMFTSDHGEAFREHAQLGHTVSVYDEELHVPAWIDAPGPLLDERERAALAGARDQPTWHVDIAPTVLDLMGIWDAPELSRFRSAMAGVSLVRPEQAHGIIPLTNCAPIWGCAFRNWGVMRGTIKLEAREWDRAWHCWDVAIDPLEAHDLGASACGDLPAAATKIFGVLPIDSPPLPMEP